jgi:ribosomal protein L23
MVMRRQAAHVRPYQGRRPAWKKAIVTLKEGDAIEVSRAKWAFDSFGR